MKKLLAWGLITGTVCVLSLFGGKKDAYADTKIASNVSIGTVDVSGMTSKEAEDAIRDYADEVSQKQITLRTEDASIKTTAADLGFTYDCGDSVNTAVSYGHKGNLIERYRQKLQIDSGEKKQLSLSTAIDESKVRDFLKANEASLVKEPVDGTLKRENGGFTFVAGKEGHSLDLDSSVEAVSEFVSSGKCNDSDTVTLVTKAKKPRGTEEELQAVKDVLGTYSTDFSTSSAARAQNVENGASKINGTLLYPGESFSVAKALNPMTAENGYAPAPSYENGTTVETYGGGICQVSTTLYNAVIRSELKVLTRAAHSMLVHYVQPSEDAAIAGFAKDFQFENSLDYPVYIEGVTSGGIITFTVYGKETRDPSRTVEFESETLETIDPETTFTADSSLPVGTVSRTGSSPKSGLKACLWKIVKENGKEVSRTAINHSTYAPTNTSYVVGTKSDSEEASAAMKSAIESGDLDTIEAAAARWKNVKPEEDKDSDKSEDKDKDKSEDGGKDKKDSNSSDSDESVKNKDSTEEKKDEKESKKTDSKKSDTRDDKEKAGTEE